MMKEQITIETNRFSDEKKEINYEFNANPKDVDFLYCLKKLKDV